MNKIIGNVEQREQLKKIRKMQNIGHAYMFVGESGIGKFLVAKEFAKAILCEQLGEEACGECECCKIFENSPDFQCIQEEDGSIKVGAIRQLSENIMLKPIKSKHRVFVIDNADLMNESAQNALLKILEEPPAYATILLVVSNQEKILKTIQSRCTILHFSPLSLAEMQEYYKGEDIEPELFTYARGSIGYLEKIRNTNYLESVQQFEKAFASNDLLEMNRILTKIKENKSAKENMVEILDLLLIKLRSQLQQDYRQKIQQIEIVEECNRKLLKNANFDIALDNMMVCLWETQKR